MGVVKLSTAGILDYSKTSNFLSGNAPLSLGSFNLLETTTLSTNTSSVTFSGLGAYSDYKHLQIRAVTKWGYPGGGSASRGINLRLNGDSGSNYSIHNLSGNGSSVDSGATASTSGGLMGATTSGDTGSPDFGVQIVDLLDFSNPNKYTTARTLSGYKIPSGTSYIQLLSGSWRNTAAVTSLTFHEYGVGGHFAIGTRISIFGVK
jgi:hypothetical protein